MLIYFIKNYKISLQKNTPIIKKVRRLQLHHPSKTLPNKEKMKNARSVRPNNNKSSTDPMSIKNRRLNDLPRCGDIILKLGDDVRSDTFCMQIFTLMNKIWKHQGVKYKGFDVHAMCYNVAAVSQNVGILEFIPRCISLTNLSSKNCVFDEDQIDRMIASAAGSYLASYILGVRDRHSDNILIHEDGTLFHIDYGYILGKGVTLDTGPFAITLGFKRILGDKWKSFVDLCEKAFMVQRWLHSKIIDFSACVLGSFFNEEDVKQHIRSALFMDMDIVPACRRVKSLIEQAPMNMRTHMKNLIHKAAIKGKVITTPRNKNTT